jgi:hypothetical protein
MLYISNQQEKTIHLLFHNKSLTELIVVNHSTSLYPICEEKNNSTYEKDIEDQLAFHYSIMSFHYSINIFTRAFVTSLLSTKYLTKI